MNTDTFKIGDVGIYKVAKDARDTKARSTNYILRTRFIYGKVIRPNEIQYFFPFADLDSYYKYLQNVDASSSMPSEIKDEWSPTTFSVVNFVKIPSAFWLDDERVTAFLKLQGLAEEFGLE